MWFCIDTRNFLMPIECIEKENPNKHYSDINVWKWNIMKLMLCTRLHLYLEFSDLDAYALHQILLTIVNLPSSVQKDLFWICVSWVLISDDILRLLYKCTNFKTLKNNNNPCRNRYKQFWILCITKLKCLSLYLFIYLDIPKRRNFKISFRTWEYSTKLREFKNDVFIFYFHFIAPEGHRFFSVTLHCEHSLNIKDREEFSLHWQKSEFS